MIKLKEIKASKKVLDEHKKEIDILLAQLIKDYERMARRPINFEDITKFHAL